jgi:hypothetical protein
VRVLRALTLGAAACVGLFSTLATAQVANPTVTGPIAQPVAPGDPSHNYIFFASNHDLAGHGYVEEEFFVSGNATRYATPNQTTPGPNSTATVIAGEAPTRRASSSGGRPTRRSSTASCSSSGTT